MTDYVTKHYRIEWCVAIQDVDQYEQTTGNPEILSVWPTRDQAVADLSNHGHESQYVKDRWIPNNKKHDYQILEIQGRHVYFTPEPVMDIVEKAQVFATAAHAAVKQVRKYTGEPYINHPIHVMNIVKTVPHTEAMLAAALLHDVVEDTGVTIDLIEQEFGSVVSELVGWLTDVSKPEDGNRAVRKQLDLEHTAKAPAAAQTIKCADLISNTASIVKHDLNFAETYLKEKAALLQVLTKGDPALISWAQATVVNGQSVVEHNRVQESLKNMEKKV
jgi:hypothetical protein